MKNIIGLLCVLLVLTSCEKTIVLDFKQVESKYVIDAVLTNENIRHLVKVTRSADFYFVDQSPRVSNATVVISDDRGKTFKFVEDAKNKGHYYSENAFAGEVGNTYTLRVLADGREFTATETLEPVIPIDKLGWRLDQRRKDRNENSRVDEKDKNRFYQALLYGKEAQNRRDYYLFKFYRNGKIENKDGQEVYFSDDELIAQNIDGVSFVPYYALNDTASLAIYSISRRTFVFYNDLANVLNNDGGMFSPIPANPRSNLSNGALGFFQVSAVSKATIIVGN